MAYVGPSTTFPEAWVTTTVMWWGDESAETAQNTVTLRDTTGKALPSQTSRKITYPFSDKVFTENVVKLDQANMDAWGVELYKNRGAEVLMSRDGATADRTAALPFKFVNMIGAQRVEEAAVLQDTANGIRTNMTVDANKVEGADETFQSNSTMDDLIGLGMKFASESTEYDNSQAAIAIRLAPTDDPTVFRAFVTMNLGNMGGDHSGSDTNATGIYPTWTDSEETFFFQAGESGAEDLDYLPNAMNIVDMLRGNYFASVAQEMNQAMNREAVRSFNFDGGGYFEADIRFNQTTGQWEFKPISGGFHAGGGLNYSWFFNALVGPVPVTASLTLGGSLEIALDVQQGHYYEVMGGAEDIRAAAAAGETEKFNTLLDQAVYTEETGTDFLTSLRLFLYVRIFAGFGFDASVIALKVGIFGQLNVDLNFEWLNRSYLNDPDVVSAVGPLKSKTEPVLAGQEPRFSGMVGIEFVAKFLFISYEKILASAGFEVDSSYGDWTTIEEIWEANQDRNNQEVQQLALPNGETMYAIDLGARLESRDYVAAESKSWVGDLPVNALILDEDSALPETLQKGAYPHANPVLSDDGQILLYLDDGATEADPEDVSNTRVACSIQGSDGKFPEGKRFDEVTEAVPVGYGDSALKLSGTEDFAAAVWVRQMETITPEDTAQGAGELDEGQQLSQMNATEIVAAIYDGKQYRYAQYKGLQVTTLEENLSGFSDGAAISAYAIQAMNWTVGQGLISGIGDNTLAPKGSATRAQVATILMRFMENVAE